MRHVGLLCKLGYTDRVDEKTCSPAAEGGDPKLSDIVFFSADYLSLWSK